MSTVMFARYAHHPTGSTSVHSGDLFAGSLGFLSVSSSRRGGKVVAVVVAVSAASNFLLAYFLCLFVCLLALCSLKNDDEEGKTNKQVAVVKY